MCMWVKGFICGTSRCKTKKISEWNAMVSRCLKIACIFICSLRQLMTAKVIPWTPKAGNSSSYKLSNSEKCLCNPYFLFPLQVGPVKCALPIASSPDSLSPHRPPTAAGACHEPPLFLICPLQAAPSPSAFALLFFVTRVWLHVEPWWCL